WEVYLASFPDVGRRWRASTQGGSDGEWVAGGKKIVYQTPEGSLVSIELSFAAGQPVFHDPTALFGKREGRPSFSYWSIAADGDRFIATLDVGPSVPPALTLVTNWQEMARRN